MRGREHFDGQIEQRARKIVRASCSMPASTVMKPVDDCDASSLSARRVVLEHAAVPLRAAAAMTRSTVKNSLRRASLGDRYSTFVSLLGSASDVSMFRMCSSDMEATRADDSVINGRGSDIGATVNGWSLGGNWPVPNAASGKLGGSPPFTDLPIRFPTNLCAEELSAIAHASQHGPHVAGAS